MANLVQMFLVFSIATLALVHPSYQIKCYSCLEGSTSKMSRGFPKDVTVPSLPTTMCPKELTDDQLVTCQSGEVCIKIDAESNGVEATGRMCGPKGLCDVDMPDGTECNECDTDSCNSASSLTITALFIGLSTAFVKLY